MQRAGGCARRRARSEGEALTRMNRIGSRLAVASLVALAAAAFVPRLLGDRVYVVDGGSMGASLPRGSLVFDEPVPTAALKVGDVITYTPPPSALLHTRVTHRIAWIGHERAGARAFRTKGDANASADPWRFTLSQPTQARVAFHLPIVGYAFAALDLRPVRIVLVGLPALVIALATLAGLWRSAEEAV